jgi:hypothetical protein
MAQVDIISFSFQKFLFGIHYELLQSMSNKHFYYGYMVQINVHYIPT